MNTREFIATQGNYVRGATIRSMLCTHTCRTQATNDHRLLEASVAGETPYHCHADQPEGRQQEEV